MHSVTRTIFAVFAFKVMHKVMLLTRFCKLLTTVAIGLLSAGAGVCLKCFNGTTPLYTLMYIGLYVSCQII